MTTEPEPYWNSVTEKLLCHMVLDDGVVRRMITGAAPAFWRAFIVQNRETGIIYAKFRYKYPDRRNWYQIVPKEQNAETVQDLREKLEKTLRLATSLTGGDAEMPLNVSILRMMAGIQPRLSSGLNNKT